MPEQKSRSFILYEFLKKIHGLGAEQYIIIIVIFCLCASKP